MLAVGDSGGTVGPTLARSIDRGLTWEAYSPTTTHLWDVDHNVKTNRWIAVGGFGPAKLFISDNEGLTWTEKTTGITDASFITSTIAYYGISCGSDKTWVLTGSGNTVSGFAGFILYSSDDGETWAPAELEGSPGTHFQFGYGGSGVATDKERAWIVTGQQNGGGGGSQTIARSIWPPVSGSSTMTFQFDSNAFDVIGTAVHCAKNKFVAVGQDTGGRTIKYKNLTDTAWTNATGSAGVIFNSYADTITYNGRYWISTGEHSSESESVARFSSDGITWTLASGDGIPRSTADRSFGIGHTSVWSTVPLTFQDAINSIANGPIKLKYGL